MKLKEKLMRDFVETRRGNQDQYAEMLSECWLNAFEKAREMIAERFKNHADWAFEGLNQGEATLLECSFVEYSLRAAAKQIKNLGEEEVT